jgi:hypothetical protein
VDNLFVVDSTTSYLIQKFKFKLSADFLSETEAVGDLSMKGGIDVNDDGKISKDEKFTVTANLAGPVAQSTEGDLWGFNTSDIVCNGVVTTLVPGNCTPEEVVYLNLLEAIDTDHKKISTAGRAITSVPLPAAAWLFGSGLMGLLAVSRRRRA